MAVNTNWPDGQRFLWADRPGAQVLYGFPVKQQLTEMEKQVPIFGSNTPIVTYTPFYALDVVSIVRIHTLPHKLLASPIDATLERDRDGFIARAVDLPLYGSADDAIEAIEALKEDIEALYEELMEDDDFSEEWLRYKAFLSKVVVE